MAIKIVQGKVEQGRKQVWWRVCVRVCAWVLQMSGGPQGFKTLAVGGAAHSGQHTGTCTGHTGRREGRGASLEPTGLTQHSLRACGPP